MTIRWPSFKDHHGKVKWTIKASSRRTCAHVVKEISPLHQNTVTSNSIYKYKSEWFVDCYWERGRTGTRGAAGGGP